MTATLPSAPAIPAPAPAPACTGIEVIPSEDGPIVYACTCPPCRGRQRTAARITTTGDPFLGAAAAADDEEW
jgi:hypothetical protein